MSTPTCPDCGKGLARNRADEDAWFCNYEKCETKKYLESSVDPRQVDESYRTTHDCVNLGSTSCGC